MSSASPAVQFGTISQQKGTACSASRSCAGAEACSPHSMSMFFLEFDTFLLFIGKFASGFSGEEGGLGFCIYFLGI